MVAIDINSDAAQAARDNAHANGLGNRVTAVCCDLLSALVSFVRPYWIKVKAREPYEAKVT